MFNKHVKTFQYGNQTVTLETSEIARQAAAAVKVSMGDTVVLVAVTTNKEVKEGQDFFPDRRLPRAYLRRRQNPRRLLQTRRQTKRKRNPDQPSDRPSDSSFIP